jgi:hypothetical protein
MADQLPESVLQERMRCLRLAMAAMVRVGEMATGDQARHAIHLLKIDLATAINSGSELLPEIQVPS